MEVVVNDCACAGSWNPSAARPPSINMRVENLAKVFFMIVSGFQ
jgi:hypothetical protein